MKITKEKAMPTKKSKETTAVSDIKSMAEETLKEYYPEERGVAFATTTSASTTFSSYESYSRWLEDQQRKLMTKPSRFAVKEEDPNEEKLVSPEHIGARAYIDQFDGTRQRSYRRKYSDDEHEEESDEEREDREIREEEEYLSKKLDDDLFGKMFNEYDETEDPFVIFKLLLDTGIITLGSSVLSANWRMQFHTVEEAREGYGPKVKSLVDHIKSSISSYFGYTISEKHLEVIQRMVLDIFITSPDKLLLLSIDNEDTLSDIIRSCKSRDIKIHSSIKGLKDVDFKMYRREGIQASLAYAVTFNTLFLKDKQQPSITSRSPISKMFNAIEKNPVVRYYPDKLDDNTISINGTDYSKKVFESILELNFEEFMANMKLESLLEEDIADESVAGTGELKSI